MSFQSRKNSFVEHVRGLIHRPSPHANNQNLIELGSLDATDILGSSLHKEAVEGSRRSLKKVLLSAICVDYPNNRGQTPLFCACSRDSEANALLLLRYGANPNEKSQDGTTPTLVSCYMGNIYLLGKLIEAGGDLRLHDNGGNGVREWALLNPDPRRRAKMLEFLDKTHIHAMAYSGDAANADHFTRYAGKAHKQTTLMEVMKMRTGTDSAFENLKRVQSMGFGKVYLGGDFSGGIVSVVPLVSEALLAHTEYRCFDAGFGTFIEEMKWMHMTVSVKKVKSAVEPEEGIDNIISEAEFLGKLRHPNIVLLMGICQSSSLENMWLIFELFEEATLHHFLHHSKLRLDSARKQSIISQVCSAMEFIHCQSFIHCGLSSMAVYLVSPHISKVGNFEFMVESIKADLGKPSRVCGVSHGQFLFNWMAPELMREEAPCFSSDIYSFCCILWEMFAGEVPWVGLKPEDIFQKVVKEQIPLKLDYASLPMKLKAIVGYGLELREENRLHKFCLIGQWLKSNTIPEFRQTHSPHQSANRCWNHFEVTSSSSLSSSLPSSSSRGETGESAHQELCSQDKSICHKRYSLDFRSPVNPAFPLAHSINLSHISAEKEDCNTSICSSDKDLPPPKPPRTFVDGHCSEISRKSNSPLEINGTQRNKDSQSLPVSPSRIKPASHSYFSGNFFATNNTFEPSLCAVDGKPTVATATNRGLLKPKLNVSETQPKKHEELEESQEGNTVKALADKYQLKQQQHKLRQAILKGSMAPRGSRQSLWTSSEKPVDSSPQSIKTESFVTDAGFEIILSSHGQNNEVHDLGSLDSTPLLKSNSTPKTAVTSVSQNNYFTKGRVPHDPKPQTASKSLTQMESPFLDQKSYCTQAPKKIEDIKIEEKSLCTDEKQKDVAMSSLKKRWAFIEDAKQRCIHSKAVLQDLDTCVLPGSTYHSPVLQFHSPRKNNTAEMLSQLSETGKDPLSSSKTQEEELMHCAEAQSRQNLESDHGFSQTEVFSRLGKTSFKSTSFKDDSFWAISSLVTQKDETLLTPLDAPEAKKDDVFNVLHADYPGRGHRVIKKADGPSLTTIYYHNMDGENNICLPLSSYLQPKDNDNVKEDKLVTNSSSLSRNAQIATSKQDLTLHDCTKTKGDEAELKEEIGNGDLDCRVSMNDHSSDKDVHNETYTLGDGLPESLFSHNTSYGSEKAVEWVDNELHRIKDNLSQETEKVYSGNDSMRGNDVPKGQPKIEAILPTCSPRTCCKTAMVAKYDNTEQTEQEYCLEKGFQAFGEVNSDDFDFPEFYIDDNLDKTEQIQHLALTSDVPFIKEEKNSTINNKIEDQSNPQPNTTSQPNAIRYLEHKPPVIPRNFSCQPSQNICQSAMSKTSELEDIRHKMLSRQSASDRDVSISRAVGVHTIAKSQGTSRGRKGIPVKPGTKQTAVSEKVRSGASDSSLSTSMMREKQEDTSRKGEDASQQEATVADDINFEEESTLAITSPNLDDSVTDHSHLSAEDKAMESGRENKDVVIAKKSEGSQTNTDLFAETTHHSCCSDSVESDQWVKEKLSNIQSKIQRRKARPAYIASSDEDEACDFRNHTLTSNRATKVRSLPYIPKNTSFSKYSKPEKCRSVLDFGIQVNENYSRVMEELKVTCKAKKIQVDASCSSSERKKYALFEETEPDVRRGSRKHFIPSAISRGSNDAGSDSLFNSSLRRKQHEKLHSKGAHEPAYQGKNAEGEKPKREGETPSFKSFAQRDVNQMNSPEWEEDSLNKESRRPPKWRKETKDNIKGPGSLSPSMPHSKYLVGPTSRSTDEDLTEVSEEEKYCTGSGYLQPSSSKKTEHFSGQETSYMRNTVSWLQNQNFKRRDMSASLEPVDAAQGPDRCSIMSRKKSGSGSTKSKHSVVSFSKDEARGKTSIASLRSMESGSSKASSHHKHEARSEASINSERGHLRGKKSKRSKHGAPEKNKYPMKETENCSSDFQEQYATPEKTVSAKKDDHLVVINLEHPECKNFGGKKLKSKEKEEKGFLGLHRFYFPKESWPDGCHAKLKVKVNEDSQRVTTTATNPASGVTETLLDQVYAADKLKSTIQME